MNNILLGLIIAMLIILCSLIVAMIAMFAYKLTWMFVCYLRSKRIEINRKRRQRYIINKLK